PICWPMISPAQLTATNTKLRAEPMARPKSISPPMLAANCHVESGNRTVLSVGTIEAVSTSANITFNRRGIRALPKSGTLTIIPAIRKKARTKVGTNWSALSRDITVHLGRVIPAEHHRCEFHEVIREPGHDEDRRRDHGRDLGNEHQCLLLNLRDGLKKRDD